MGSGGRNGDKVAEFEDCDSRGLWLAQLGHFWVRSLSYRANREKVSNCTRICSWKTAGSKPSNHICLPYRWCDGIRATFFSVSSSPWNRSNNYAPCSGKRPIMYKEQLRCFLFSFCSGRKLTQFCQVLKESHLTIQNRSLCELQKISKGWNAGQLTKSVLRFVPY